MGLPAPSGECAIARNRGAKTIHLLDRVAATIARARAKYVKLVFGSR